MAADKTVAGQLASLGAKVLMDLPRGEALAEVVDRRAALGLVIRAAVREGRGHLKQVVEMVVMPARLLAPVIQRLGGQVVAGLALEMRGELGVVAAAVFSVVEGPKMVEVAVAAATFSLAMQMLVFRELLIS